MHLILSLILSLTPFLSLLEEPGADPSPQSQNAAPLLVHDPVMAYADSTFHLYATGWGIQHATSRDLRSWQLAPSPVMTVIPQWARDSVPGFRGHVWAPDVIQWHDRWWMAYSCSTFGRNTSAIGLLSNRSLDARSPWNDEGCIIASREGRDNWNAIDPNFIIDDDDRLWLVFGSFWDGIQLMPLTHLPETPLPSGGIEGRPGLSPKTPPSTIARRHAPGAAAEPNPTSQHAGTNAIEAPFIFRHAGYYYLFVSWDYCCRGSKSNYRVACGRSRSIEGPYVDRQGKPMLEGGGTVVLEGDKTLFEAAGHCAVYHLPTGEDLFLCHGYSLPHEGASLLVTRRIRWTQDQWPELEAWD